MTEETNAHKKGIAIGLDVGQVRIGVAVAEVDARFAVPKETLKGVDEVADFLNQHNISLLVVGWPLELTGREGRATKTVAAFMEKLLAKVTTVDTWSKWDERLTTTESAHLLREAGKNAKQQKSVIDQVAATKILQSYLDAHPEFDWSIDE